MLFVVNIEYGEKEELSEAIGRQSTSIRYSLFKNVESVEILAVNYFVCERDRKDKMNLNLRSDGEKLLRSVF